MADFCDVCFKQVDVFNPCEHQKGTSSNSVDWSVDKPTKKVNPAMALLVSPVMGFAADWVLPVWSTPWLSAGITLILGAPLVALWMKKQSNVNLSQLLKPRNILNALVPPLALKAHDFSGLRKDAIKQWSIVFVVSLLSQLVVLSPGNAQALANQVRVHISETNGASMGVSCPSPSITILNSEVTCEVDTGILAFTVPARVDLTQILNSVDIKVALN